MKIKFARLLDYKVYGIDEVFKEGEHITLVVELDEYANVRLEIKLKDTEKNEEITIQANPLVRRDENGKIRVTLQGKIPHSIKEGKYKIYKILMYEEFIASPKIIESSNGPVLNIEKL